MSLPPYASNGPHHFTWWIRTIELGANSVQRPSVEPPSARGDFTDWLTAVAAAAPLLPRGARPLVALDANLAAAGDARRGLGLPNRLIAPTQPLIDVLSLDPSEEAPFVLCHDNQAALTLVTWRCLYETSDYHLPRPRLAGSAVLIQTSALDRLPTGRKAGSFTATTPTGTSRTTEFFGFRQPNPGVSVGR
jgi:hypothetical protein